MEKPRSMAGLSEQLRAGQFAVTRALRHHVRMSEIGLRLLQLQEEFSRRNDLVHYSREFNDPDLAPRPEAEIAADYEQAIRELLATQPN